MEEYLAVEIEHTRYARFLRLDRREKKSINLTTLVDRQKKAEVKVYLLEGKRKQLIHSFFVSGLSSRNAGEPRLRLTGEFDGHYSLRLSLHVEGKKWGSKEISLKKQLKKRSPLLLVAVPLAVLILAAVVWLGLRSCAPPTVGRESTPTAAPDDAEQLSAPDETEASPTTEEDEETVTAETTTEDGGATETATKSDTVSEAAGDKAEDSSTAEDDRSAESVEGSESEKSSAEKERDESAAKTPENKKTQPLTEDGDEARTSEKTQSITEDGDEARTGEQDKAPALPEETKVYFNPDSSTLLPEAQTKLRKLSETLTDIPRAEVIIVGHCALYGTERGRIELSRTRARHVESFLKDSGWKPEKEPEVRGLGGQQPITKDEEKQNLNRRVEITVEHPES